jgi:glycine cleavage system aminomethyltransferase T
MDNTDTISACGLQFTCDFNKSQAFIGQERVLEQKAAAKQQGGLLKRMANVLVTNPDPLMHHGEVLWRNDKRISDIRMASYGHTIGGAVGLTMLQDEEPITKDYVSSGEWQVEIVNKRYPCKISFAPFYDPKNLRVKM